MAALREHNAAGDVIVIASGGLNLYLPELLIDVPHAALICTDIGMQNNVATGEMINGNCVRLRKAERVSEWLAANGPFGESFGYGNYPHDVPMMNLVKHRIIVS
jgi:phosphoserine phosphatase